MGNCLVKMKVCHLTSAHTQEDIRIFYKECVSLADAGHDVYQISCGDTYDKKGVHLIGIGAKPVGRLARMRNTAKLVYQAALKVDADVYHIHDPELLPYGLKLKRLGKKVIFDSHEDVPAQIMDKEYIAKPLRKIVSVGYKTYESYVIKHFDAVVAATPHIAEKFTGRCSQVATVNNYPRLDDIELHDTPFEDREPIICYAGGISEIRGEQIMIDAMQNVDGMLIMAGNHARMSLSKVNYTGMLNRNDVNELYGRAIVGLCILKKVENYFYSQPIKMYEYMAAGLPFICSDFPLWRKVAIESGGGICVNPENTDELSSAISNLLSDRKRAQYMGRCGRKAVLEKYNWANEEKKLLALYNSL